MPPNLFDTPVTTSTPPPAGMGAPLGAHLSGPSLFPPTGGSGTLPLSSSGTAPPRGAAQGQGSVEAEWDAFVGFDDPRKVPFTPPPQSALFVFPQQHPPQKHCHSLALRAGEQAKEENQNDIWNKHKNLFDLQHLSLSEKEAAAAGTLSLPHHPPPPNPLNSTVSAHMPHSCPPPNQPNTTQRPEVRSRRGRWRR